MPRTKALYSRKRARNGSYKSSGSAGTASAGGSLAQYINNRKFSIYRAPKGNSIIIPRTVVYDTDLTVDVSKGFGFSATNLWVNGVSTTALGGASDITALFDLVRVAKVEITVQFGNNTFDYGINTVGTGTRNMPYVYDAFDPSDSTNPALTDIRQMATCQMSMPDKALCRTIYPVLQEPSAIVDIGAARKNKFMQSGTDIPWNGWKVYMDLYNTALTYDVLRFAFKIYFECKFSF